MRTRAAKLPWALAGVLLVLLPRFLPPVWGLSADAAQVLGIFLGTVLLWLAVDVSWPSVLCLLALSLLPGVGTGAVLSASFGNATIWFLVFSFLLTFALSETGFLRRVALAFLSNRFAAKSPLAFGFMFLLAVLALGSFIAPTVTFLLFFALHREAAEALGLKPGSALMKALMVGTACVTSVSCAMTPIAHTFPLMALGFYEAATGETISYLSYLRIGLPAGLLLFACTCLLLWLGFGRKIREENANPGALRLAAPGPLSRGEVFSALVFFLVVLAWLLTGIFPDALGKLGALGTVWPAMAGVLLLSALPLGGKPPLDLKRGLSQGVSWVSILLCAAALALGKYVAAEEYGMTRGVGELLKPLMSSLGAAGVTAVLIAATVLMTNLISNIVTTTVMYNLAAAILPALAVAGAAVPMKTAAILVGMCASLAFATPPAIAHVALAAGSDWAGPGDMLRYGGVLALLSVAAVLVFALL